MFSLLDFMYIEFITREKNGSERIRFQCDASCGWLTGLAAVGQIRDNEVCLSLTAILVSDSAFVHVSATHIRAANDENCVFVTQGLIAGSGKSN